MNFIASDYFTLSRVQPSFYRTFVKHRTENQMVGLPFFSSGSTCSTCGSFLSSSDSVSIALLNTSSTSCFSSYTSRHIPWYEGKSVDLGYFDISRAIISGASYHRAHTRTEWIDPLPFQKMLGGIRSEWTSTAASRSLQCKRMVRIYPVSIEAKLAN